MIRVCQASRTVSGLTTGTRLRYPVVSGHSRDTVLILCMSYLSHCGPRGRAVKSAVS